MLRAHRIRRARRFSANAQATCASSGGFVGARRRSQRCAASLVIGWNLVSWQVPAAWLVVLCLATIIGKLRRQTIGDGDLALLSNPAIAAMPVRQRSDVDAREARKPRMGKAHGEDGSDSVDATASAKSGRERVG